MVTMMMKIPSPMSCKILYGVNFIILASGLTVKLQHIIQPSKSDSYQQQYIGFEAHEIT